MDTIFLPLGGSEAVAQTYLSRSAAFLPSRARLETRGYERLATFLACMRRKYGFAITAWVFLPDHRHAIIYPPCSLTISTVFKVVKVKGKG